MAPTIDLPTLIELRHTLHRYPELSGREKNTANIIIAFLKTYQPTSIISGLGGDGVAAVFEYAAEGPTIVFRCELDALPIREQNKTLAYRSTSEDVSHQCGHDGHMAIVAGLAQVLAARQYAQGRVVLLFQPAEETGMGAAAVLRDQRFLDLNPTHFFALHNLPGIKKHQLVLKRGAFNAAVISFIIRLTGKIAHAAEPENGINPARAVSHIIRSVLALAVEDIHATDFTLITPIYISMGSKAYGTSAGAGELHFTARAWNTTTLTQKIDAIKDLVNDICRQQHLDHEIVFLEDFAGTTNDDELVDTVIKIAEKKNIDVDLRDIPFRWGEDFGQFTDRYSGVMFGLGAGENHPALHHDTYDFPDDIIDTGIKVFTAIADDLLQG